MTLKELKKLYPEQSIVATIFYAIIGFCFSFFLLCNIPFVGDKRKNIIYKNREHTGTRQGNNGQRLF